MNNTLVRQLAIRYLRGKRSANAVPVLSRISMVAIAVGSGAMIVLFSVFNGFEHLVQDLYKAFYPDLKLSVAKGKFFVLDEQKIARIRSLKGVEALSYVLEDKVYINTDNNIQRVASVKGIDASYFKVNNVKPYIVDGRDSVSAGRIPTAIAGELIANQLGADPNSAFSKLILYYPNLHATNIALNPASAFVSAEVKVDGVFQVQEEFDSKYILAPLPLVQYLLQQDGKYSSIELKLAPNADRDALKKQVQDIAGSAFRIETRFEQNKTLFMVMRAEKWAVYAILLLVMLIASFNMIGALSLLVLEKRKDMAILKAMGAQAADIRRIFVTEGLLWSFIGGLSGLLLGFLLCLGQKYFGWIKLPVGAFIIESYPVRIQSLDFVLIIITIIAVGLLASWVPAARAMKGGLPGLKS
ncbi:MAG: FtsX-like permease family protein [Bacteroidetes bacterium]|nr:FtsX-like permease family protein [Bacteroidota bacterium]